MNRTPTSKFVRSLLIGFTSLVGAVIVAEYLDQPPPDIEVFVPVMKAGAHHKELQAVVDYPAIQNTTIYEPDEIDVPESSAIVGIEVDGEHFAFVLDEMMDPKEHIVNLSLNRTQISVAYCNLVNCVRVLNDESDSPIPLSVGGLDVDRRMVLLFHGERYGHLSKELPLSDYPFARMRYGDWKRLHPRGRICMPPRPSAGINVDPSPLNVRTS